jgi:hypothetical protein
MFKQCHLNKIFCIIITFRFLGYNCIVMKLKLLSILLFSSCFDYKLQFTDDNAPPPSAFTENDQQWIEGYPAEDVCDDTNNSSFQIEITEGCEREPQTGILDATMEWERSSFHNYPEYAQIVMAPVVGQLNDDTEDGLIDWRDTPDIVIITDDGGTINNPHGVLRILNGSNGDETQTIYRGELGNAQIYPYRYSNVALGDIDNDGEAEIVFIAEVIGGTEIIIEDSGGGNQPAPEPTTEPSQEPSQPEDNPIRPPPPNSPGAGPGNQDVLCSVAAINADLQIEWYSPPLETNCGGHALSIADLEGDGEVEIIIGNVIIRGSTGEIRFTGQGDKGRFEAYTEIGLNSIVSDINMDGLQEVIAGRSVYNAFGQELCRGTEGEDGFTAAADLDEDGYGEFIVVGNQMATIFDTDCTMLHQWALVGGGTGGPPTIADYDGDLYPEIGLVDASFYTVYEKDGTILWSAPVTDMSSHATGSIVFDFEGDGFPEVVYGDELALWIFDGRNGSVRLRNDSHNSRTLHEYPTIADLDGDGSAEIIVVNGGSHHNNTSTGIFVLGSSTDSWQRSRQVWNQHAYSITNINEDLSIPETPVSNWPLYNNFRSGDVNPIAGSSAADATPLADVCLLECYLDRVVMQTRIANQGPAPLRAGLQLHVYAEINGQEILIGEGIVPTVVPAGEVSDAILFRFETSEIPEGKVWIVVDQDNYVNECVETNNRTMLENITCP